MKKLILIFFLFVVIVPGFGCKKKFREEHLAEEFIEAAQNGDVGSLNEFIKSGVDVDIIYEGHTALMAAAESGYLYAVICLLSNNAKVNLDVDGITALHFAVISGNEEIVKLLLKSGGIVTEEVFDLAVSESLTGIVIILIEYSKRNAACLGNKAGIFLTFKQ
ncbi:ankyrin repeat domain-containing protein [Candidatus Parcubacteria bacterium]|nr:MAG: ankyrin repeat domain-containing protein [Candidatus Parcubacteria bacterium]